MRLLKKFFFVLLVITVCTSISCSKSIVERGTIEGNQYVNSSIGITFTKPSNWYFLSKSQIADLMDITQEMFEDEDLFDSDEVTNIIEFVATISSGSNNINMGVEKLKSLFARLISVERYIESTKSLLKTQNPNANYTFSESEKAILGNEEFVMITAECNYYNQNLIQYIYFKKVGIHMVVITATTSGAMSREMVESCFS